MKNHLWIAFVLYGALAAGVLFLIGVLFAQIFEKGADIDGIALISVLSLLFRDVVSKMGDVVRAMNGQSLPDALPLTPDMQEDR